MGISIVCRVCHGRCDPGEIKNGICFECSLEQNIIKVNFELKFINISGKSAEETVEEIKDGGNCLDIYENEDGTVTVEINKQQQEYWLTSRGELLEELQEQLKEYDENYRLEHNDSYT